MNLAFLGTKKGVGSLQGFEKKKIRMEKVWKWLTGWTPGDICWKTAEVV